MLILGENEETVEELEIEPSKERDSVVSRSPNEGRMGRFEYRFNEKRVNVAHVTTASDKKEKKTA
jgi:hypothetical protein